ncbi:hypothetical protein IJT93_12930 [bacterium]|nr:hypothetical protein [bacterium]
MRFNFIRLGSYLTAAAFIYTLSLSCSWAGEGVSSQESPVRFELTAQASESASGKEAKADKSQKKAENKSKAKKGFISKKNYKKPGEDTQVDFIRSEDGFWNSRGINDPTLTGSGSSLNSVMFESRGGRRVKSLPSGPVHDSDVEFTGGQKTEVTINGRRIEEASDEQKVPSEQNK